MKLIKMLLTLSNTYLNNIVRIRSYLFIVVNVVIFSRNYS